MVGLQRDPSIREGKNKPIQTEEERKDYNYQVEYVDEVIVYDTEEDLVGLLIEIKTLMKDTLVPIGKIILI